MFLCPPILFLWLWLRRVAIGSYSYRGKASNPVRLDVLLLTGLKGRSRGKEGLITINKSSEAPRCRVNGEWERGRLQTFRFLSSWFSFTSASLLRLVAATGRHRQDVGPFSWNFQLSCCSNILQTQERLFWIHVVDTNTRLTNLLLNQSTPITTMFIPHDCATEHRCRVTYWFPMSDTTYL